SAACIRMSRLSPRGASTPAGAPPSYPTAFPALALRDAQVHRFALHSALTYARTATASPELKVLCGNSFLSAGEAVVCYFDRFATRAAPGIPITISLPGMAQGFA